MRVVALHVRAGVYVFPVNLIKWTYIVLDRIRIGWPKNAGTFSSINECVLIKFSVASGNVLESLWHDPGRGSGT